MPSISTRIPEEVAAELEAVADLLEEDESSVIRKALTEGLCDLRVRVAVERYQTGELSTNQAAQVADVSVAEWLKIARDRNLTSQLSPTGFVKDITAAREL